LADRAGRKDSGTRLRGQRERQQPYDSTKVRGGEIILRTRLERVLFIAGLGGAMMLGVVFAA